MISSGRYRKPTVALPPHEYCDRWCERCPLQRTRCDLFVKLYPQGVAPRAPRIRWCWNETVQHARALLRGLSQVPEVVERVPQQQPADPLLACARPYTYGVLDLLDRGAPDLRRLAGRHLCVAGLSRCSLSVWSKLCRAASIPDPRSLDAILSAQVAHQSLIETLSGLCRLFENRVQQAEAAGLLFLGLQLARQIEQRWLRLDHVQLVPARDELDRWGPICGPYKHRALQA